MFPSSSLATLGFPYLKDNYIFSVYLAAYILVHLMSSHVRNCFHTVLTEFNIILMANALCSLMKIEQIFICALKNKLSIQMLLFGYFGTFK